MWYPEIGYVSNFKLRGHEMVNRKIYFLLGSFFLFNVHMDSRVYCLGNVGGKSEWAIKELSLSSVDDVVGLSCLWDSCAFEARKYCMDISYFRALWLLSSWSIEKYASFPDGFEQYEKFWMLVDKRVRNRMSYFSRFACYIDLKLYGDLYGESGLSPESFMTRSFFEEVSSEYCQERDYCQESNEKCNNVFFIATLNNKNDHVVGSLLAIDYGRDLEIRALVVQKEYRRKGVALSLLKQIEEYAMLHNVETITFCVSSNNNAMLRCALRAGYLEQKDEDGDSSDFVKNIVLHKSH